VLPISEMPQPLQEIVKQNVSVPVTVQLAPLTDAVFFSVNSP